MAENRGEDVPSARLMLRPIATPMPLGFLAQMVATVSFGALQLRWIEADQATYVALSTLALVVPLLLISCVMGFLARDPVAATGMGVLAGAWGATALATLELPTGETSPGLGVVLLLAGVAMLVTAIGGRSKIAPALVMLVSFVRFGLTGVAEVSGSSTWLAAAGYAGLVLGAVSLYAALALELEGTSRARRTRLPVGRVGDAKRAVEVDRSPDPDEVATEPGARGQL